MPLHTLLLFVIYYKEKDFYGFDTKWRGFAPIIEFLKLHIYFLKHVNLYVESYWIHVSKFSVMNLLQVQVPSLSFLTTVKKLKLGTWTKYSVQSLLLCQTHGGFFQDIFVYEKKLGMYNKLSRISRMKKDTIVLWSLIDVDLDLLESPHHWTT